MDIKLPENCLVITVGAMGTGKSTFLKKHFPKHSIVSTDAIREQLCGDFESMEVNEPTFEILYATIESRLKHGLFTVVDSTGSNSLINQINQISKKHNKTVVVFKFPSLPEDKVTKARMKHRWKYIDAYYAQVKRIERSTLPKNFVVYDIPESDEERNNVVIDMFDASNDGYLLNPEYEYVIVPDLHGEYTFLREVVDSIPPDKKIVQLGDIVDRGESSYVTFQMIKELIKAGRLFGVQSNHDNKFYRWLKKWKAHTGDDKYGPMSSHLHFGMKLADGLHKTVSEFFSLDEEDMRRYAYDFIKYYESLPPYLVLERKDKDGNPVKHFFSHAGVTSNILRVMKPSKYDVSSVLYRTIANVSDVREMAKGLDYCVVVHLGHDWLYHKPTIMPGSDAGVSVVKHDFGLGKRGYYEPYPNRLDAPETNYSMMVNTLMTV